MKLPLILAATVAVALAGPQHLRSYSVGTHLRGRYSGHDADALASRAPVERYLLALEEALLGDTYVEGVQIYDLDQGRAPLLLRHEQG